MCYFQCLECYGCHNKYNYLFDKKCGVKECLKEYLKKQKALCKKCNQTDLAILQTKFLLTPRVTYETVYIKKGYRNVETF